MKTPLIAAFSVFSLGLVPAPAAHASDGAAAAFGFILGLAAGSASARGNNSGGSRASSGGSRASTVQRGDVQIQHALNHFGFDAGPADGAFGPRTRDAIRRYQAAINADQTGTLTPDQASQLLAAYADANRGGATAGGVASSQMPTLMANLRAQDTPAGGATTGTTQLASLPGVTGNTSTESLPRPRLCDGAPAQASGFVPVSGMETIVNSYCTALSYALAASVEQTRTIPGYEAQTSQAQCAAWRDANAPAVMAALAQPPEAAVPALRAMAPASDAAQQTQLRNAFVLCHGLAESGGDSAGALIFAAMAAASGGAGYGELVAAPLAIGYETAQSQALGSAWYFWTAEALAGEGAPLISSPGYDHVPLLVALADSAAALPGPWTGAVLASAPASLPGLGLPGVTVAAPQIDPAAASVLPANFEAVYGLSRQAALDICRTGGTGLADLGRVTCRGLAAWANDAALYARFN